MNEELQAQIDVLKGEIEDMGFDISRRLGSNPLSARSIADKFVARKAGMSGAGTATTDIRFWAGKLFPDRATAPFRVDDAGKMVASTVAISQTIVNIGGTGADGALTISSGTTTIDLENAPLVTKNYTSISITGTGGLAFSNPYSGGTVIILKSQGDVTITSTATRAIDYRSLGATAGSGGAGATPTGEDGGNGTNSFAIFDASAHYGGGGDFENSNAGGAVGAQITIAQMFYARTTEYVRYLGRSIIPGAGGGGGEGGGGTSDNGGAGGGGGRGAGASLIEVAGAYNVTGTIDLSGATGTAGTNGSITGGGGGGGGGAGGMYLAVYNTLTADSGTYTVTGGSGGAGGTGTGGSGAVGGYGGGGAGTTEAAGIAGAVFSTINGGAGGAGADGIAVRMLNTF